MSTPCGVYLPSWLYLRMFSGNMVTISAGCPEPTPGRSTVRRDRNAARRARCSEEQTQAHPSEADRGHPSARRIVEGVARHEHGALDADRALVHASTSGNSKRPIR